MIRADGTPAPPSGWRCVTPGTPIVGAASQPASHFAAALGPVSQDARPAPVLAA